MNIYQKQLLEAVKELAEKEGLELKIATGHVDPKIQKWVSDFIRKIDEAEKKTRDSKLKFDFYVEPLHYVALPSVIKSR